MTEPMSEPVVEVEGVVRRVWQDETEFYNWVIETYVDTLAPLANKRVRVKVQVIPEEAGK